jgi:hypothetical protein
MRPTLAHIDRISYHGARDAAESRGDIRGREGTMPGSDRGEVGRRITTEPVRREPVRQSGAEPSQAQPTVRLLPLVVVLLGPARALASTEDFENCFDGNGSVFRCYSSARGSCGEGEEGTAPFDEWLPPVRLTRSPFVQRGPGMEDADRDRDGVDDAMELEVAAAFSPYLYVNGLGGRRKLFTEGEAGWAAVGAHDVERWVDGVLEVGSYALWRRPGRLVVGTRQ